MSKESALRAIALVLVVVGVLIAFAMVYSASMRQQEQRAADAREMRKALAEAHKEKRTLQESLAAQEAKTAGMAKAQAQLEQQVVTLEATITPRDLWEAEAATLRNSIASLEARNLGLIADGNHLRGEIAELEAELAPLTRRLRDTRQIKASCVGESMAPTIVCGDIIHLVEPTAEALPVGAIIDFQGTDCRREWFGFNVLHRVINIRYIGGEPHYWPRGDANPVPDGCWIAHSEVVSYVWKIEGVGQ